MSLDKTTTLVLTEREMLQLVMAVEAAKRESYRNNDPVETQELLALRNKLRQAETDRV